MQEEGSPLGKEVLSGWEESLELLLANTNLKICLPTVSWLIAL